MTSDLKHIVDTLQKLGVVLSNAQLSRLEASPAKIAYIKAHLKFINEDLSTMLDSILQDPEFGPKAWPWEHSQAFISSNSSTPTEYTTAPESLSASFQNLGSPSTTAAECLPGSSETFDETAARKEKKTISIAALPARPITLILEFLVDFRFRADPSGGCHIEARGLFAMTWMCHHIRTVAMNHPPLWGQILRVDSDSLACFKELLKRSDGGPICLCTSAQDQILPLSPEREHVWELAIKNASRCVHLAFDDTKIMDHHPLQHLLKSHFQTLEHVLQFRGNLSAQQVDVIAPPPTLIIQNPPNLQAPNHSTKRLLYRTTSDWKPVEREYILDAPTLRTVRLFGQCGSFPVEEPQWSNITVLQLHGASFNGMSSGGWTFHYFWHMLSHLSGLEEISIIDSILVPCLMAPTQCANCNSDITLPRLRRLTVCTHFALFNDVFAFIKIPKSASIDIRYSTLPRPLWIDRERRLVESSYIRDAMSLILNLFPTDLDYTTAHLQLYRNRISYSLSTDSNQSYSFTMDAMECSRLTIEEIHDFFYERLCAFQKRFASLPVKHLVLGCNVPSVRKYADSLRSVLIGMPGLTSIQSDTVTLDSILTLSGIAVESCFTGMLMFSHVTKLYVDHNLVDSLTTWSSLCFYMVWRTDKALPPITQVIIDITKAGDHEELSSRCREVVERLPRFFKSLQVQLVAANVIHTTYSV